MKMNKIVIIGIIVSLVVTTIGCLGGGEATVVHLDGRQEVYKNVESIGNHMFNGKIIEHEITIWFVGKRNPIVVENVDYVKWNGETVKV